MVEIVNPQDAVRVEVDQATWMQGGLASRGVRRDEGRENENAPGERIVQMSARDTDLLRSWLEWPNGSFSAGRGRVTFEAVEGGGVLVRTLPYGGA